MVVHLSMLKRHDQAKIIKNQCFYFHFLIWPYDVNMSKRLELRKILNFFAAHLREI